MFGDKMAWIESHEQYWVAFWNRILNYSNWSDRNVLSY